MLVDIFFALLVVGISALLFEARSNAISRAKNTWSLRIARMLASQKMEDVLVNELSAEPDEAMATSGDFDEEGYKGFTFEIDGEEISISSEEDLEDPDRTEKFVRRVTVTISYEGERKAQETFSLSTILPYVEEEESGG